MGTFLTNANFCRLCASETDDGFTIFDDSEEKASLAILINKYLPIKVVDDGRLPIRICERCHVGVAATVDLIDRMVEGQQRLSLLQQDLPDLPENEGGEILPPILINIQGEGEGIPMDDLAKGTEVLKVFPESHPMSIAVEGPVKRKRGRPKKCEKKPPDIKEEGQDDSSREKEWQKYLDDNGPRRSHRKASLPTRFRDTIAAGSAFEALMMESGVNIKEEIDLPQDFDDVDYRHQGSETGLSILPGMSFDDGSETQLEVAADDGTSIVIAADTAEPPSDLPHSVNIEVDFQDDGNITLRGMEDLSEGSQDIKTPIASVSSVQITPSGKNINMPPPASFNPPTLFRKKRGAKKKAKWMCEICGKGFLHKGRFTLHTRLHKQVIYQCETCKDKFSTREDINIHQHTMQHIGLGIIEIENRIEQVEFKCPHCPNRTFVTQEGYNNHVASMHDGQKPHACATCGKRFAYQHSLRNHYALHEAPKEEREYPCVTCGKVFTHPSSLIYHRDSQHNNGRMFVCPICNSSFKHKQLLQRHFSVHSEDRPYPCEVCSAAFKSRGNLYNHMNTHTGLKKFTCEICGKQFNHLTSLTLHVRSHTGEKPFKCDYCGKRFTQNGNLQEHIRIHTGEKPYCCESCGKKFTTSSQFKLHMRRHTGERPFTCSFCNKGFVHRDACKTHERKHRGEKPYVCEICNKGFTEQYTLKKHLRMHTGEKPYACTICGRTFSDASNLHKHRRSHRSAEQEATWLLPADAAAAPTDQDNPHHRIIYILSDKEDPESATIQALQHVDGDMGESGDLEGLESSGGGMLQLNPDNQGHLQGFTFTAYDQAPPHAQPDTAVMLGHTQNQESPDRHIQIFTNEDGQSVIPVINSTGETIGEVQGHFLGNEGNNSVGNGSSALSNVVSDATVSGGNSSTLEITLKGGQPLNLVIPDGEDPTLYVQRALESAVLSQSTAQHVDASVLTQSSQHHVGHHMVHQQQHQ